MIFESSEDQWRTGGILSGDSWKDERVVEVSQKLSISKLHIENKNRACYSTNTQMQSNICNVSIFINSFTSNPDIRVRIQNEKPQKKDNTCLIKEVDCIYWYIYKFCVIICIKLNSSSLQVLYLYKRGELLMNQRKSLKELNLLDKFLFDEAMDDPENAKTMLDIILLNTRGKHPELVSLELIELLKYMERSMDEVSGECKSKRIQEMHRRVCQIKASEKTEVKYMQSWEERIMIKQEGIAEGRIEGEKALLKSLIEKKMAKKYSAEQISAMLEVDVSEVENIMKEIQSEKYL